MSDYQSLPAFEVNLNHFMVYSTQYAVAGFCAAGSVLTVVLVVFMYCFKRQGGGDVPDQID